MTSSNDDALCSLFLSLSDPTRLRLLRLLAAYERSVGYLAEQLGESQPKVSRHLAFLREHDVVTTRRDGKHIYYRINEASEPTNVILSAIVGHHPPQRPNAEPVPSTEHIRISTYIDDPELPVYLL
ncbi:MAG TPA: metalloregulator ArsR/SmtB family transcription factor [Pyrinomonadaceae bacterium]|nr:metalloregulator ArsR/SmtB family transcription factor [Pyrinomonadaceae bacterium]